MVLIAYVTTRLASSSSADPAHAGRYYSYPSKPQQKGWARLVASLLPGELQHNSDEEKVVAAPEPTNTPSFAGNPTDEESASTYRDTITSESRQQVGPLSSEATATQVRPLNYNTDDRLNPTTAMEYQSSNHHESTSFKVREEPELVSDLKGSRLTTSSSVLYGKQWFTTPRHVRLLIPRPHRMNTLTQMPIQQRLSLETPRAG